jgi:hypothetical protein
MKKQLVVTHRYTVLKDKEKVDRYLLDQHLKSIYIFTEI